MTLAQFCAIADVNGGFREGCRRVALEKISQLLTGFSHYGSNFFNWAPKKNWKKLRKFKKYNIFELPAIQT